MHQLQLHDQSILVKTFSDKESSDDFIKAHQKKTEVIDEKLFKSYQIYQAAFQEKVHLLARQMRNRPSSLVFLQDRASCSGDLFPHESKTCHAELTSCCCCAAHEQLCGGMIEPLPLPLEWLLLWRGGWESIGDALIENPMFVQVRSHRSTTRFRDFQGGIKHWMMIIFAAVRFLLPCTLPNITTTLYDVLEWLLLWDVQALVALLGCYVHARRGNNVAAVSLPGQSGRAANPQLTTWSPQSGSDLVEFGDAQRRSLRQFE